MLMNYYMCLYETTNPAHLVLGLDVMPKHRSLLKVIPGETSKYYDSNTEYVSDQTVSVYHFLIKHTRAENPKPRQNISKSPTTSLSKNFTNLARKFRRKAGSKATRKPQRNFTNYESQNPNQKL